MSASETAKVTIKRDGLKVTLIVEGRESVRNCSTLEEAINLYNDVKRQMKG